ncbi:MAG: shikimate kinase [Planctomycetota bacterium]
MNIFLIGYRGTGKSTVAPALANRLGPPWNWLDLDADLETQAGRSIAELFATEGEAGFRDRESRVLANVARGDRQVVATGGGVVLRQENRDLLRTGWIVWLTASAETIAKRVEQDALTASRRPNLTTKGGREEIRQLLQQRVPLYQQLAHLVMDTEIASAETLAEQIAASWRARPADAGNVSPRKSRTLRET